ncbi:hypothetical protein Tco_0613993 [Tanacetum coccineum]
MNELNELRDQAYENSLIYKEKMKKINDSKIKNRVFNVGDRVLLFNSRLKIFSGKLKTRWTGQFTVAQVFPYGTVELSQTDGPNFKLNDVRNDVLVSPRLQSTVFLLVDGMLHSNQGFTMIAWRIIKIEGPGLVDEEHLKSLEPSPLHYK